MTPAEADNLAFDLATSWPRALAAHVWADSIGHLDASQTRATLRTLRADPNINTLHGPSVGQFLAEHRRLHATNTDHYRTPCAICDGLGWEQITVQRPGHPHPTTGVVPCRCSNGRQHEQAHRLALEHNRNELAKHSTISAPGAAA